MNGNGNEVVEQQVLGER